MWDRGSKPVRRLRAVPSAGSAPEPETAATLLPANPRIGALDSLLREVDGLRLTLETDLSLAAAAVEAGAPDVAMDILEADRDSLHVFEDRALDHLAELSGIAAPRRHWARVPAAPFVAAAAVVGFLLIVPHTATAPPAAIPTNVSATTSLQRLTESAAQGETSAVRAAAADLHEQLASVVAHAKSDPAAAQQALLLLSYEQNAIVNSASSRALRDVLAASTNLANLIRAALPARVRTSIPPAPVLATVPSSAPQKPASKPGTATTSPKATTSPAAKPAATSSPSPQPSPSSSPRSGSGSNDTQGPALPGSPDL